MTNRLDSIKEEIKNLHDQSNNECLRTWFFAGHVLLTAQNAQEIAVKVGANAEISVLAALFHDIARTWDVNDEPALMDQSLLKAEEIMKKYNYTDHEIKQVKLAITTHSCREKLPETEEGKVLATADALAHLLSDFYFILPFNGWLNIDADFADYKNWLLEKIERDLHKKIFYPEYQTKAQPKYEAIKTVFSAQ